MEHNSKRGHYHLLAFLSSFGLMSKTAAVYSTACVGLGTCWIIGPPNDMIKDIHFRPSERFLPRVERKRHVSRPIPPALLDSLETTGRLAPPPPEPSLVSSVFDTFDRLLFTLPEEVFTHRAYGKVFKDLFRKLPDRVQFVF